MVMVQYAEGENLPFGATLVPIISPAMGDSRTGLFSCISISSMQTTSCRTGPWQYTIDTAD